MCRYVRSILDLTFKTSFMMIGYTFDDIWWSQVGKIGLLMFSQKVSKFEYSHDLNNLYCIKLHKKAILHHIILVVYAAQPRAYLATGIRLWRPNTASGMKI